MAKDNFQACLKIILREEGGNDDDPQDPGGRTSRGIIQREWDAFIKTHPDRPKDVWKASDADIATIYQEQYWQPYCEDMPAGLDLMFFNTSVLSGRTQAVKELQRGLGVSADGMIGMVTKQAIADCRNIPDLIHKLSDQRRTFYHALKTFSRFGNGWLARTDRVEKDALSMAAAVPLPERDKQIMAGEAAADRMDDRTTPKAPPTSVAQPVVSPQTGSAATAAAGVSGGVVSQLQTAVAPLTPFSDTLQAVKYILLAVAVISFGITAYAIWKDQKNKQAVGA